MGCGLLYTEMVSAKALSYHNKNTEPILETEDGEHPLAVQLFGSEPELLADMAKKLEEGPYDIIDLNMGCPVPKAVSYTHLDVYKRQPLYRMIAISCMDTNKDEQLGDFLSSDGTRKSILTINEIHELIEI